jgi:CheY-like chemotaxis protein
MDVHMPVMDGLEATQRIKADPRGKETIVVALTASAMDDDRERATQSGADGFITKPCREEELLEKIGALLNITYEYEQTSDAERKSDTSGASPDPVRLPQVPPQLLDELRNATRMGNKRLLDKLIRKLGEDENAEFSHTLQEFADRYDYDSLTRLLEEVNR